MQLSNGQNGEIECGPDRGIGIEIDSGNVVGYNVYRSPDGTTWKKVNASLIASTLYGDTAVANSTTYYYAATAVDVSGHESTKTAAVKVVVP